MKLHLQTANSSFVAFSFNTSKVKQQQLQPMHTAIVVLVLDGCQPLVVPQNHQTKVKRSEQFYKTTMLVIKSSI